MAISIKSLDTRVTTLENRKNGIDTEIKLLAEPKIYKVSGTVTYTLTERFDNFAMMLIVMNNHNNAGDIESFLIPITDFNVSVREATHASEYSYDGVIINFANSSGKSLSVTFDDTYLSKIYGFSRIANNLYYKLLGVIGGVVKWLYL